jgi:hypothetical protein
MYKIIYQEGYATIIGNGKEFFFAKSFPDNFFERKTKRGLIIRTQDLDYLAIGAHKCKTFKTAKRWLHAWLRG